MRVCSICRTSGHNKQTCKSEIAKQHLEDFEKEQSKRKTLSEVGREIIAQENKVVDREPDDLGTLPQKGLWIVSLDRKRIAGKISQVKKDGTILWVDIYNCLIESSPQTIKKANYKFVELEPYHLSYEIISFTK